MKITRRIWGSKCIIAIILCLSLFLSACNALTPTPGDDFRLSDEWGRVQDNFENMLGQGDGENEQITITTPPAPNPCPIPTPPPTATREEEIARDHLMQKEIFLLLSSDGRFSRETWNSSNRREREAILTDFLARVQGIKGTMANPSITFIRDERFLGRYLHRTRWYEETWLIGRPGRIEVNERVLEDAENQQWDLGFRIIIHEVRHAYQHEAIDDPWRHTVSDETRGYWRSSINIDTGGCRDCCWDRYAAEPREWDAFHFMGWGHRVSHITPVFEGSWGQ